MHADQFISTSASMSREPHAITRARERYGVELTLADLDGISVDVAAGRTMRLAGGHDGTARHAVLVRNLAMIAVVGKGGRVITFVPREKPLSGSLPFGAKRARP